MKKNLNIIHVNGFRGIIFLLLIGCCLAAGFIVFPGYVAMGIWNYIANFVEQMPAIGVFQGVLLWGIAVISYFTFRKERVIVCLKSPQGLSDEELKTVFNNLKKNAQEDKIIQAMIKARDTELKLHEQESGSTEIIQNNEINKN